MGPPQLIELAAESKESRDAWVQALSASAAAVRLSEVETSADALSVTLKGPVRKRGGRKGGVSLLWRERFMVLRGDGVAGYFASEAHFAKCTDGNRVLGAAWNQCAKGSFECRGLRVVDSSAQEDPEGFRFSLLASDTADDDDGEDDDNPGLRGVFGEGISTRSADAFRAEQEEDEVVRKQGVLDKRTIASTISWSQRFVTLTSEHLYIRYQEDGPVREKLSLLEVSYAQKLLDGKASGADGPARNSGLSLKGEKPKRLSLEHVGIEEGSEGNGVTTPKAETEGVAASPLQRSNTMTRERGGGGLTQPATKDKSDKAGLLQQAASQRDKGCAQNLTRMHAVEWENVIEVYQEKYGRTYYLRAEDESACEAWVGAINACIREAEVLYVRRLNLTFHERMRLAARHFYDSTAVQLVLSSLLLVNFVISIVTTELDLDSDAEMAARFDLLETIFTFIYLSELLLNMYGHWWADFFYSGWNWFDLIIVSVSLADAVFVLSGGGGTGLNVMRLIRIFRIVRIFNKLDDLKRILNAIISSMGQV